MSAFLGWLHRRNKPPQGVWLGVWLNRRIPEALFQKFVYVLPLLAGIQLIFNFDLFGWLR